MDLLYWPYDEVTFSIGEVTSEVVVTSPWLKASFQLDPTQSDRIQNIVNKFNDQNIHSEDIKEFNWLFKSLSAYPFCYILPGSINPSGYTPQIKTSSFDLDHDWKWDREKALEFSQCSGGYDAKSLFSIARRFHLLSCTELDQTEKLYAFIKTLKDQQFKKASVLVVRQNHYVTQRCNECISSALENAQGAKDDLLHFIEEEKGHDKILNAAIKSIVDDAHSIPLMPSSIRLMDLLKFSGQRNFLAFSILVDAFERSAYQEVDPFAQVLQFGGLDKAAAHIDVHKNINDGGGHENLALGFISNMAPISREYADEALKIMEISSFVMNSVAQEMLDHLQKTSYLR